MTYNEIEKYLNDAKIYPEIELDESLQTRFAILNLRIDEYIRFLKKDDKDEWRLRALIKIFDVDMAKFYKDWLKGGDEDEIKWIIYTKIGLICLKEIGVEFCIYENNQEFDSFIKELDDKTNLYLNIESIKNKIIAFEKNRHIMNEIICSSEGYFPNKEGTQNLLELLKTKMEYKGEIVEIIYCFINYRFKYVEKDKYSKLFIVDDNSISV